MKTNKWRSRQPNAGRDHVKDASRRLGAILKTSRRFCVSLDDLRSLDSVSKLRIACTSHEPSSWHFMAAIALGVIISVIALLMACGNLTTGAMCHKNTTNDIQIQTIRLDRLSLESSQDAAEERPVLVDYNDSEESEEAHVWQPPRLRLHRER